MLRKVGRVTGALSRRAATEVQPKVQEAFPRFSLGSTSKKYSPPTISRKRRTIKERYKSCMRQRVRAPK